MGICIEKIPCKLCGSANGLQVFKKDNERFDGYCFACASYIADPYEDMEEGYKPTVTIRSLEDIQSHLEDISHYRVVGLPERLLREEALEYFDCKVSVSETDGTTPTAVYFPYKKGSEVCAYKVRLLEPKKMWCVGQMKETDLFGWEQAVATGAKRLFITEGEYDAIALYQVLVDSSRGTAWESYLPAVVSVPSGVSGAAHSISNCIEDVNRIFPEVVLAFDMDEPGQKGVAEITKLYPHIMAAKLPAKDANLALVEGRSKALKSSVVFKAKKPKNTSIIYGSTLGEAAKKKPEWGLSWPWQKLTDATRGIRRGETYYIGAGVKMGKSELVNALGANLIVEHELPIFVVKPEEAVVRTYQMMVGKVAHRIFHDPSIEFDTEAFDKAEPLVRDKLLIQDVYQFVGWDNLKNDIRYVVNNEGVQDIFLDPITCFVNQLSSSAANEALVAISAELSAMAKDLNFTAYIFCHLKAPDNGSHERGAHVYSNQFAGSRAMMRSCNYMIGMEGDKDPEQAIEHRNQRTLVILEDREFGITERIPLYWDNQTGMFNEI